MTIKFPSKNKKKKNKKRGKENVKCLQQHDPILTHNDTLGASSTTPSIVGLLSKIYWPCMFYGAWARRFPTRECWISWAWNGGKRNGPNEKGRIIREKKKKSQKKTRSKTNASRKKNEREREERKKIGGRNSRWRARIKSSSRRGMARWSLMEGTAERGMYWLRAVSATKSGSNLVLDGPGVGRDKERLQGGGASEREREKARTA